MESEKRISRKISDLGEAATSISWVFVVAAATHRWYCTSRSNTGRLGWQMISGSDTNFWLTIISNGVVFVFFSFFFVV
jgi:hypothetical protein